MQQLSRELLGLFFPPVCLACDEPCAVSDDLPICLSCQTKILPAPLQPCLRCGMFLGPYLSDEHGCRDCRRRNFAFDETISLGLYRTPLAELCQRAKSPREASLARALTRLLIREHTDRLRQTCPDAIVPVPRHWTKLLGRQNSAPLWMAHELSRALGAPLRTSLIRQHRRARTQHLLKPGQRRKNVADIFRVPRPSKTAGKRVLLVDDIMTSGETLDRLAKLLKAAGASYVACAITARTPSPQ